MRIIQNLLILLVLMVGLLFAARQAGAAMGKGDVLAYIACRGTCIPILMDMRTMLLLRLHVQRAQYIQEVFWTENGDLYTIAGTRWIPDSQSIYRWGSKILTEDGDSISYVYPARNENNLLVFIIHINGADQYRYWDGVQWIEPVPPIANPYAIEWSADGRFAFVSTDNTLYISDGVTMTSLGQASDYGVRWSVNGHLAFASDVDGNGEIYVWDGAALTNISQHAAPDYNPVWGPDGRLAFISERDGNHEIYVWDGEALTNASQTPEKDYSPTWSEDGQLAFLTEGKNVSIWGKEGVHRIELEDKSFQLYSWQWLSHGRLLFFGDTNYIWDQGVTVKFFTYSVIEYGDRGIVFVSDRYRTDGLSELYMLDGQNVVGTGLVGKSIELVRDGKGGLVGRICVRENLICDLYYWKDGQAHRLTNTPDISEHSPSFRP
jgi:WD40-like Beta Propeller Repeat